MPDKYENVDFKPVLSHHYFNENFYGEQYHNINWFIEWTWLRLLVSLMQDSVA